MLRRISNQFENHIATRLHTPTGKHDPMTTQRHPKSIAEPISPHGEALGNAPFEDALPGWFGWRRLCWDASLAV